MQSGGLKDRWFRKYALVGRRRIKGASDRRRSAGGSKSRGSSAAPKPQRARGRAKRPFRTQKDSSSSKATGREMLEARVCEVVDQGTRPGHGPIRTSETIKNGRQTMGTVRSTALTPPGPYTRRGRVPPGQPALELARSAVSVSFRPAQGRLRVGSGPVQGRRTRRVPVLRDPLISPARTVPAMEAPAPDWSLSD